MKEMSKSFLQTVVDKIKMECKGNHFVLIVKDDKIDFYGFD